MIRRTLAVIVALLIVMLSAFYLNKASSNKQAEGPVPTVSSDFVPQGAMMHTIGDSKAPLTLYEYASFSCSHCASFANIVLPKIKEKYIQTGILRLVFVDLPADSFAFKASMIAHCYAPDPLDERFFDIYSRFFYNASEWAYKKNFLDILFARSLMSLTQFNNCVEDKFLEDSLLASKIALVSTLRINAVPTFIINGQMYNGYRDFEEFEKIIDSALLELQSKKPQ